MQGYAFCGDLVWSTVPLPELCVVPSATCEVQRAWTCDGGAPWAAQPSNPVHQWLDDAGEQWLRIDRTAHGYRLVFAIGAEFEIARNIVRWTAPGLPMETVRHLLVDQVLPLAMSASGVRVLHAAGIAIGGAGAALVGASGQGKSTLAAACAARGGEVFADDCVRVDDDGRAYPSYPGVRLWPDAIERQAVEARPTATTPVAHYTRKIRVATTFPREQTIPLRRIYLLEWAQGREPEVNPAGGRALVDLTRFSFRMDPTARAHLAADFNAYAGLVEQGIVRRLAVPRTLDRLAAVTDAIVADLCVPIA